MSGKAKSNVKSHEDAFIRTVANLMENNFRNNAKKRVDVEIPNDISDDLDTIMNLMKGTYHGLDGHTLTKSSFIIAAVMTVLDLIYVEVENEDGTVSKVLAREHTVPRSKSKMDALIHMIESRDELSKNIGLRKKTVKAPSRKK